MKQYNLDPDGFTAASRTNKATGLRELSLMQHGMEIFRAELDPDAQDDEIIGQANAYARLAEFCEARGFRKGERAAADALRKLASGPFAGMMERLSGFGGEIYDDDESP